MTKTLNHEQLMQIFDEFAEQCVGKVIAILRKDTHTWHQCVVIGLIETGLQHIAPACTRYSGFSIKEQEEKQYLYFNSPQIESVIIYD